MRPAHEVLLTSPSCKLNLAITCRQTSRSAAVSRDMANGVGFIRAIIARSTGRGAASRAGRMPLPRGACTRASFCTRPELAIRYSLQSAPLAGESCTIGGHCHCGSPGECVLAGPTRELKMQPTRSRRRLNSVQRGNLIRVQCVHLDLLRSGLTGSPFQGSGFVGAVL